MSEGIRLAVFLAGANCFFCTFAGMKREKKGNVCVFCASSANIDKRYLDDARELGRLLAEGGWRCVNGGGAVGLIPKFMVDNGWCYDRLEDVVITADMHQRKSMMSEMADAVIALPGGVGTMEELLETLTWRQLGLVKVPVIILNTLGYYDSLLRLLEHAIDEGFMKESHAQLWQVADTPQDALALLNDRQPVEFESKYF